MNIKQTATEYLFEKLWETPKDKLTWNAILEQAKEMEQYQIEEAYYVGDKNGCGCYDYCTKEDAQQYYKETYDK
jgi:hypothetical protein